MGCMEKREQDSICPHCGFHHDTPPESPLYLTPGTILHEKYLIGRVLGHGGFGITYLALDLNLHVKLAVKEYLPRDMATRSFDTTTVTLYTGPSREHFEYGLKKFIEEARALARFEDLPGIVSVKDFFQANETAYFVMHFVEGITFKEYLQSQGGKINYDRALRILMPVMDALREVHKTDLLHRDISPDNIYITQDGRVKLLDFGAARYAAGEHSKSLSVMLKAGYAPEEQYRSKGKQGPWTDIYAVGATLYRAITGNVPLEALDRMDADTLESPSRMGIKIPLHAEQALLKAMNVKAGNRFQEMEMFQQALVREPQKIVEPDKDKTSFKNEDRKKRSNSAAKRKVIPALLIGLFALIAFSIFSKPEQKPSPIIVPESKTEVYPQNPVETLMSVESELKSAAIYIDNHYIGETDIFDIDIEPGRHVIKVKKEGYETYFKKFTVEEGQKITLIVNFEKSAPSEVSSTLTVVTDPPDAKVRILNIKPIYQPGIKLRPGRYQIEVTANGYNSHKKWINLGLGEERREKIVLNKKKKQELVYLEIIWNIYDIRYEGFMILKEYGGKFRVRCIDRTYEKVYDIVDQTVSVQSVRDGIVLNCSNPISHSGIPYSADNFKFYNDGAIYIEDNNGSWSEDIVAYKIDDKNELEQMVRKYKF